MFLGWLQFYGAGLGDGEFLGSFSAFWSRQHLRVTEASKESPLTGMLSWPRRHQPGGGGLLGHLKPCLRRTYVLPDFNNDVGTWLRDVGTWLRFGDRKLRCQLDRVTRFFGKKPIK